MVVDRLSAEDRLLLWSDASWPQDIGAVAILDGRALLEPDGRVRIEAARAAIAGRLHRLPRFRQILDEPPPGLGWPLWVDAPRFDLRQHVQVAQVPPPGDETQLLQTIERLRRCRLDRSRPMWEIWFLPGLAEDRVGMFIRVHHVIAAGVARVAARGSLLDAGGHVTDPPPPPWSPRPGPTGLELFGDNVRRRAAGLARATAAITHPATTVRRVRDSWPALRSIVATRPGPPTSLNRLVGAHRSLALVRSTLEEVALIAHDHRATVNDVLLAVTAAGLRGLLAGRGEPVDHLTVPIYVPISLRRDSAHPGAGNLISQMVVPLPLGPIDAGGRLDRIARETSARKAGHRPSLGTMFRSRAITRIMLTFIARQRVNVETADIPGPAGPLFFAGARLLEVFPLVNLVGNVTLGVGAVSYAGQFGILAVGDADTYPDLDIFAAAARTELRALSRSLSAG
jgi:WS/DGAT/MGAT family acyltransferase